MSDNTERFLFRYLDDEGNETEREPLVLPHIWEICGTCRGEGRSSAYLGAITQDEWAEDWDYEEQERYMAGGYDRTCDECGGAGKVKVVDEERFQRTHSTEYAKWQTDREEEAAYHRMCEAERRMGA
jgi:hypothetical protein